MSQDHHFTLFINNNATHVLSLLRHQRTSPINKTIIKIIPPDRAPAIIAIEPEVGAALLPDWSPWFGKCPDIVGVLFSGILEIVGEAGTLGGVPQVVLLPFVNVSGS